MARYADINTTSIFDMVQVFRERCLLLEGSLLFEDAQLWRPELVSKLHTHFVGAPDEGDRTYLEKLHDQIVPLGPDAVYLTAEMHCIYFLFPSSVGGSRKRHVINKILGWAAKEIPENHPIKRAFDHGIGSGGQGYNTRRPIEISFLMECVVKWKSLPQDELINIIEDPWRFQEFMDRIEDAETKQIRHMLLHMLFPDYFERIASGNHKRRVIKAFSGLLDGKEDKVDKQILNIRRNLESLLTDSNLDFYDPPLAPAWYDEGESNDGWDGSLEVIQYKKQVVLYGPPGTGKTYRAKRLAERVIRSAALTAFGPARYFKSQTDIDAAIRTNVHRLQLHPAYSYEDFVRGLHISADGATEYRPGYLLRLIKDIEKDPATTRLPHVLILDEINRTDLSRMLGECFSLLEDRNESVELPANDENGSTFVLRIPDDLFVIGTMNLIDQSIEQIDFALRRRFLWIECPFDADAFIGAAETKWKSLGSKTKWDSIETDFRMLAATATMLNGEIRESSLLGPQYEIGHTYLLDVVVFLHNYIGSSKKQNYLWNTKRDTALVPIIQVWDLSLRPLLEQYLAGLDATSRNAELARLGKVLLKPTVTE